MATHLDLEEQEQLDQLKHFWNTWGTLITGVVMAVSAAVLAWNGYQWWQARQAAQASALADAVDAAVRQADAERVAQAFGDLRSRFASAVPTAQAALVAAKQQAEAGQTDAARATLQWAMDNAGGDGYRAIARLRLAGLLLDAKEYDQALAVLSAKMPPEFDGLVADRRGDVLLAQGKQAEAAQAFQRAHAALQDNLEYRRVIEFKLGTLGVAVDAAAAAQTGKRS